MLDVSLSYGYSLMQFVKKEEDMNNRDSFWANVPYDCIKDLLAVDGEVDYLFGGMIDNYLAVSETIPKQFTIIDLGCGQAVQSWLFKDFHGYVGVEKKDVSKIGLPMPDAKYCTKTIQEFIKDDLDKFDLSKCYAICNGRVDRKTQLLAVGTFPNIFSCCSGYMPESKGAMHEKVEDVYFKRLIGRTKPEPRR